MINQSLISSAQNDEGAVDGYSFADQGPDCPRVRDSVLAEWNGDLAFDHEVIEQLGASEFDILDLLLVIEHGVTTTLEKETANESVFERFGMVDDGAPLCVMLSYDPHMPGLTVAGFSKP